MLIDLLRDREIVRVGAAAAVPRYATFKAAASSLVDWEALCIPLIESPQDDLSFVDDQGQAWAYFSTLEFTNEQRKLTIAGLIDPKREIAFFRNGAKIRLSSGQRTYFRFALHFVSFISLGSLVIFDEPETHLHPNLVSQFMVLLYKLLSAFSSVAIIATHSIYVVREAPTHCNHVLKHCESGETSVAEVYLQTLGASPTSLSMAIFGDDTAINHTRVIAKKISRSGQSIGEVISELSGLFSMEMLMEIRALLEAPDASA
jgi:hypothetical protein